MAVCPWHFRGGTTASFDKITALLFDPEREMLWVGNRFGNATGITAQLPHLDTLEWKTHCTFQAVEEQTAVVGCATVTPPSQSSVVAFASATSVNLYKHGGFPVLRLKIPQQTQRRIAHIQSDHFSSQLFLAGDNGVAMIDIEAPNEIVSMPTQQQATTIHALRVTREWIVAGYSTGNVVIYDRRSTSPLDGLIKIGSSKVNAIGLHDHVLYAASSERAVSAIKIFDIRSLSQPLTSITLQGISQDLLCYSVHGSVHAIFLTPTCFHILEQELSEPVYSSIQVEEGMLSALCISANGRCAAIGNDKGCLVSLSYSQNGNDYFSTDQHQCPPVAKPPLFTHSWSENKDGELDSGFDYNYPEEKLFSSWPPENYMILACEAKLRPIPSNQRNLIRNLGSNPGVGRSDVYLPDPKDKIGQLVPNPYPYNTELGDDPTSVCRKLLEMRKGKRQQSNRNKEAGWYTKPEEALQVCYSTHTRFDWSSVNAMPKEISGIDNTLPESWIAPLLQCMYLVHPPAYPVRRAVTRHFCRKEHCVACEISIIFSNMYSCGLNDTSPIVQISNLLRVLRRHPLFVEKHVFQKSSSRDESVRKLHLVQRLLLDCINSDLKVTEMTRIKGFPEPNDYESIIVSLFGTQFDSKRTVVKPQLYWEVPTSATKVDEGLQHLLKQLETFQGEQVQIKCLPPILVLLLNPEHGNLKPPSSLKFSRPPNEEFNYSLCSNVIHLADDFDDSGHFVSHHRCPNEHFVLVNDYFVSPQLPEDHLEAAIPSASTHSVVITYYSLETYRMPPFVYKDRPNSFGKSTLNTFDFAGPLILLDEFAADLEKRCTASLEKDSQVTPPLSLISDILPEHLIAIDAEYVVLDWGNKREDEPEWIRRQRKQLMSLARVSCILSVAEGKELTILDDYICTDDTVLDYVTQFSGIHEGDLDINLSPYRLSSYRSAYLKLRALVDRGCRFVGHGLPQDFRVCNIVVPNAQVIDTLELYSRGGSRKLSLRYLAYHVLGERVQEDEHDSVEDARTSLRLYRKYEELMRNDMWNDMMDLLLMRGSESNWSIPGAYSPGTPMTGGRPRSVSPPVTEEVVTPLPLD